MTHETPAQRRTRLIEQYAGQLYPRICHCDATIDDAAKLADAVIAATPQEPLPKHTKAQITLLKELIKDMLRDMSHGDCSLFLAHDSRFDEICDGLAPDPQEPEPNLEQQLKTARLEVEAGVFEASRERIQSSLPAPRKVAMYDPIPSEIETRLLELMQSILDQIDFTQGKVHADVLETWKGLFAIIKRDLGLV